jgi:L-seryl-tRNA(Ser) seleniumtransferase
VTPKGAPPKRAALRALPSVESLLRSAPLDALAKRAPRSVLVRAAREAVAAARAALRGGSAVPDRAAKPPPDLAAAIAADAARRAEAALRPSLRPVINATGVIVHTNLGRAPLAAEAVEAVVATAGRFSNLEFDLERGVRGSRMAHLEPLLRDLLGAPAALVVNNNAAAMILALNTLARGKETIVSRGELVEIGGSFRIPEILERAGTTLREVGTTNKTKLRDYERAAGPATGAILSVHTSNFAIVGFSARPEREELVALARRRRVPLIEDVGSGALVDFARYGLGDEPLARKALAAGVPLVTASADKLLGGPQAGILAGSKTLIAALKENPLTRALRVDKLTLAALEATLRLYRDPARAEASIPVLRMLGEPAASVRARARRLLRLLGAERAVRAEAEVVACVGEVGGGALPLARVPSFALSLRPVRGRVGDLARALRTGSEPVLGRVESNRLLLDLRTVAPREVPLLAAALAAALDRES